jgi:hypothetical protein
MQGRRMIIRKLAPLTVIPRRGIGHQTTNATKSPIDAPPPLAPSKASWLWKEGRGGTDPPDARFWAVASVVVVAGGYAWFIDPPKQQRHANEQAQAAKKAAP